MTKPDVVFCTPTVSGPLPGYMEAFKRSVPLIVAAGIEFDVEVEAGNPYISGARATLLRKALDKGAETVVFIDHDLSWDPEDLLTLVQTPGDVVAGTYRFKADPEEYMGEMLFADDCKPRGRAIGETLVLEAGRIPAGFMKITRAGVARFMRAYPHLCYGDPIAPHVDLFNHGAHEGVWWGEDYAFSRNWRACGGELLVIPDLSLTHHNSGAAYPGNYHDFLMRQPGGAREGMAAWWDLTSEERAVYPNALPHPAAEAA